MSNYSKRNDKMLAWIGLSLVLVILGAFALKGIMPWVIYLGIIFLLLAIYAEREAERDAVKVSNKGRARISQEDINEVIDSFDKSDYKAMYNPPEEVMQRVNCKKCNNEVYQICMCNPVKEERKAIDELDEPEW